MLNLPNMLTLMRILAVPGIVVLLYYTDTASAWAATVLFILTALTDMFDGMLARKQQKVTSLGKFLDPLADKILIGSILIMLVWLHRMPAWIAVVIVCRELTVTGLRAVAAERGEVIAADKYGKIKTIFQILALIPLIFGRSLFGIDLMLIGMVLLYVATALTVFSGVNYLYTFYRNLVEEEKDKTS